MQIKQNILFSIPKVKRLILNQKKLYLIQSQEFAHSIIAHLLISLKSNERLWAICSDRSRQMSDHELIAQVAQDKWATMSDSLRSLRGNKQMSDSLKKIWLKKSKILYYYVLFKV